MVTYRDIKKRFFELEKKEQERVFKDIYNFSKDMKSFLNSRLGFDDGKSYISEIKKALDYYSRSGIPKNIKVSNVNRVIQKAKKANVSKEILIELEYLAFCGYIEFLDEFGADIEQYEVKAYEHLKNYLNLYIDFNGVDTLKDELYRVENFLSGHSNMYNEHLFDLINEFRSKY